MNIPFKTEDIGNNGKDPCYENTENKNILCNGEASVYQKDENGLLKNSKFLTTTKITRKESGQSAGVALNKSFQKIDTLTRSASTDVENRILLNKGFCFGNIGFGARINKALKKPHLSILRGPQEEIPRLSLLEYFEKQFSEVSFNVNKIAIRNETKSTFSYAALNRSANGIANQLRELLKTAENHNRNKDIVIAVCLTPDLKFRIPIIFAILKLGATYLPINHDYPEEKVRAIVDGCKVVASILSRTDTRAMDRFQSFEDTLIAGKLIYIENFENVESGDNVNSAAGFSPILIDSDSPVYPEARDRAVCILPSFNNNGVFSGIRYHSRTLLNLLHWERKTFPYERTPIDSVLSYFFDTPDCMEAIKEIFFPLLTGQTLVIFYDQNSLFHPEKFLGHMMDYQVTKLVVYPKLLRHILNIAEMNGMMTSHKMFSCLKVCFCVGEPISIELATLFFHYTGNNKQLVILYGHDENTSTVTYQIYESLDDLMELEYCNYLPAGIPISNYKLYIVNRFVELVPMGVVGEICLSGSIVNEMYGGPEIVPSKLTKNVFTNSKLQDYQFLLRTGDYGRIIDKRLVYETGRNKHVYIDEHYFNFNQVTELLNNWHNLMNSYHIFLCYQLEFDRIPKLILFADFKSNSEEQNSLSTVLSYLQKKLPKWAIPEIIPITFVPQESRGNSNNNNEIVTNLLEEYEAIKRRKREFSNWKHLNLISAEEIKAAKVLLYLLSNTLPISVQEMATNLFKSIFDLGATSFITLKIVQELNKIGYHVTVEDVDNSKSLLELISKMIDKVSTAGVIELKLAFPKILDSYQLEMTLEDHKSEVIEVLAHSYTRKDTLDFFCQVQPKEIRKLLEIQWPGFIKKSSSLTLKRLKDKKIVGAILGIDWNERKRIKTSVSQAISHRLQLQKYLEKGFCEEDDKPKEQNSVRAFQIAHFGLLSNLFHLSELYEITNKMISDTIQLAKSRGYTTILMTVYDLYVAELCEAVWGFTVIRECQANKVFTDEDKEPYADAPDSLICKFMKLEL